MYWHDDLTRQVVADNFNGSWIAFYKHVFVPKTYSGLLGYSLGIAGAIAGIVIGLHIH